MKSKRSFATSVVLKFCVIATVSLLLNACGGSGGAESNTGTTDTTPDIFSFTSQTDSAVNQWVTSSPVIISGINSATNISIQNGEYAVNGGNFTNSNGSVNNGNSLVVRHMASTQNATETSTVLTIGGVSATFTSRTIAASSGGADATVNITFPLGKSKTNSSSIRVSGNARSESQLASLSVNGIAATIADNGTAGAARVSTATTPSEHVVNWYADVPLAANEDNSIAVSVTDSSGNSEDNAASVEVSRKFAPSSFSYDGQTNRLFALVENNELVSINLLNNEYSTLGSVVHTNRLAYAADKGKVFHAYALENSVSLHSTDIQSGVTTLVHNFNVTLSGEQFVNVTDIVYADISQTLYFILSYPASTRENHKRELYGFNLNNNTLTLVSGDNIGSGPRLETDSILVVNDKLLGFTWERDGLVSITPSSGDRSLLLDGMQAFNMALAKGETDNIIYTAGFEGVFRIDLASQQVTNISPEAAQDIYVTAQIQSLALDSQNNRLLMSDSSAGLVLAVDLDNGVRSKVLSSGVGDGRYLLMPQFIATDIATNTVYLLDANTNAQSALLAVDLSTANRSFVVDSNLLPNTYAYDLLFDKNRNRLIAVYDQLIVAVNLTTKEIATLQTNSGEAGIAVQAFNGGAIDDTNNKLYVSAFASDNTIIEIDLITNQFQIIPISPADANTPVSGIVDIAINKNGNTIYLASQSKGLIHKLDMTSGQSQVIVDTCNNVNGTNMLDPAFTSLQNMIYDPHQNSLLTTAGALLQIDLADNSCKSYGSSNESFIDVSLTSDNQLLVTQQNKLIHYDRTSSQGVVISR